MMCFLDSILIKPRHITRNYASNYALIEVCMHCAKLTSKVCAEQYIEALVYIHDKAHIH